MKKLVLLFFVIGYYSMAVAHAGMFDRYLEMKVSVEALVLVMGITQAILYLFLRFSKSRIACWYKGYAIHIAKILHRRTWLRWCLAWILSSFVCTPYLYGLSTELFFFAFIPLLIFLFYYCSWVWNGEKRKKHLTGVRGLSIFLSAAGQQVLGYLFYALICETPTFHQLVYYTDDEYSMFDFKLFPGIDGFYYMAEGFACIAFITIIPYILLFLVRALIYIASTIPSSKKGNKKDRYVEISHYTSTITKMIWVAITIFFGAFILLCWLIMTIGGILALILKILLLNENIATSLPSYLTNYAKSIQEAFLLNGIGGWIQLLLFNLLMPLYVLGQFIDVKERVRSFFCKKGR